jgi:hypothetical protein
MPSRKIAQTPIPARAICWRCCRLGSFTFQTAWLASLTDCAAIPVTALADLIGVHPCPIRGWYLRVSFVPSCDSKTNKFFFFVAVFVPVVSSWFNSLVRSIVSCVVSQGAPASYGRRPSPCSPRSPMPVVSLPRQALRRVGSAPPTAPAFSPASVSGLFATAWGPHRLPARFVAVFLARGHETIRGETE